MPDCRDCHKQRSQAYRQRKARGEVKPPGHKALDILQLLQDGQWHATQEIRELGGVSYNARIKKIRDDGYQIVRKRDYNGMGGWQYKLILDPSDPDANTVSSPTELLLSILRDGRWHSNEELYERLDRSYQDHLYFLRKEGFQIAKKRDPETNCWCYKLEDAE